LPAPPESHGAERRHCDLRGIRIAEVAMAGNMRLAPHAHASGQLVFVLGGSYFESWATRRVRLVPGSVIFRPARARHSNDFPGAEVRALVVSYRPERLGALADCRQPFEMPRMVGDLRRGIELELGRGDRAAQAALEGFALLLQARAARASEPAGWPLWLGEALRLIERHYGEAISLATLAAEVGVHRATLAAAFRRHLDRSVGEAIREARLTRALVEIRRAARPLAEIAGECGFFDQAHMGRLVKRCTGQSPGDIRRSAQRAGRRQGG
jgi:AraC-like DNA-binding protein/quercetin dioxygenase-like cupin family protein